MLLKLHMSKSVLLFVFNGVSGEHFKSHNIFLNFRFFPNVSKNREINLLKVFTVRNLPHTQKLVQVKEKYFTAII